MPDTRANWFRKRRFSLFRNCLLQVLARKGSAHILDVGGTREYWLSLEPLWWDLPVHFTIINLDATPSDYHKMSVRPGNACAMPEFEDNSFDIVHSNSVIEHVGQWTQMNLMAQEVRRLAPVYFVQTPNLWFPIEPHYKLPFVHWLPTQMQAHVFLARKRYLPVGSDYGHAFALTERVNLLSRRQLQLLFPDARLVGESFAGFTKSWIAVRDSPPILSQDTDRGRSLSAI